MAINTVVIGIVTVFLLLWYFLKRKTAYWANRGIPFVKPDLLIGNLKGVATQCHVGERWQSCYNELKDSKTPIGGVFLFTEPVAIVLDLDFLRNVFVKDFNHFRNHGTYVNEKDDPLSAHLFSIEDDHWKNLRTKLSPTFTSGKMKMMFPTIQAVANQFQKHLKDITKSQPEVEFKELLSQFSTDVIGSTAFGIECNTMKDPNGELRETTKLIFGASKALAAKMLLLMQFPELGRMLKMKLIDSRVTKFFMNLIGDIVKHREENNVKRNDFMSLLLQIKNTGRLEGESSDLGKMTFNELAAQVFLFFFAGYETSSSTMTFALYELAKNPDVQEKARKEVQASLERHGGVMSYEAAMELTYIDQIINGKSFNNLSHSLCINFCFFRNAAQVPNCGDTFQEGIHSIYRSKHKCCPGEGFNSNRQCLGHSP